MIRAVTALVLMPAVASAAEQAGQQFSFLASFLQMMAALALVIGLILVTWHFSGKLLRGLPVGHQLRSKHIRIIETRYLGPKKSLLLIEVGGEYLLLANGDTGLSLIKEISMFEDIEVLEEEPVAGGFLSLLNRMRQNQ